MDLSRIRLATSTRRPVEEGPLCGARAVCRTDEAATAFEVATSERRPAEEQLWSKQLLLSVARASRGLGRGSSAGQAGTIAGTAAAGSAIDDHRVDRESPSLELAPAR